MLPRNEKQKYGYVCQHTDCQKGDYAIEMHCKKSIISSHLTNLYIKSIACILSHVCQKPNVRKPDQNKNKNEFEEGRNLNCL